MKRTLTIFSLAFFLFLLSLTAAAQVTPREEFRDRHTWAAVWKIYWALRDDWVQNGRQDYATLPQLVAAGRLDSSFASTERGGYVYELTTVPRNGATLAKFTLHATPKIYGKSGRLSFSVNERGAFRPKDKGGARVEDSDWPARECPLFGGMNEQCVINDLRRAGAAEWYYNRNIDANEFPLLWTIGDLQLLPALLSFYTSSGYNFSLNTIGAFPGSPARFRLYAVPETYGVTGVRSFLLEDNGALHAADRGGLQATVADPVIANFTF